jgi:GH24 family phage-related lysozyme (muramidase)
MTPRSDALKLYSAGIELLKEFEGCHLTSYRCPAGFWTIGWGNTNHFDGEPVKKGDRISQAVADEMLAWTIELRILPKLRLIPHWEEMSEEQQGALISFAFNLGWEFYGAEGFETISRRLRNREWAQVPEALLLYRNPGSSFEEGLRRRRTAEGELWRKGMKAAAAGPAAGGGDDKPLFTLEAVQNTWLKKKPIQAAELSEKGKLAAHRGRRYGVRALTELPGDAHARVELAAGAGTWHVFLPHWRVIQPVGEALVADVDWSNFDCLVTPNLTVGEILQWDRRRIPGPDASVRKRILETAAEFQRIRQAWAGPLGVTSFYRPEPINQQVGGVPNSRHVSGRAMDIYPSSGSRGLEEFYQWIRPRWRGGLGDGRRRGFIHLDTDGGGFVPGGGATPSAQWDY